MKVVNFTNQEEKYLEGVMSSETDEAHRLAVRENAKQVLQESGLAEMLKTLNKNALKGRGSFYEYDFIDSPQMGNKLHASSYLG